MGMIQVRQIQSSKDIKISNHSNQTNQRDKSQIYRFKVENAVCRYYAVHTEEQVHLLH